MNLEETIQYAYDFYPDLYQERYEVLDHLFFTIGNGFEWENGELVCHEDKKGYIRPLYIAQLDENDKAIQRIQSEQYNKIKSLFKNFPHLKRKWYPLCSYSKIFNLPKNIKKDWKDGAIEIINLFKEDGNVFKLKENKSLKIVKKKIENSYNYYIAMLCSDLENIFFNHDLIVSSLLGLTLEQYREKSLNCGGFVNNKNRQIYFNKRNNAQKMLDELECYLVMDKLAEE